MAGLAGKSPLPRSILRNNVWRRPGTLIPPVMAPVPVVNRRLQWRFYATSFSSRFINMINCRWATGRVQTVYWFQETNKYLVGKAALAALAGASKCSFHCKNCSCFWMFSGQLVQLIKPLEVF